MHKCMCFPLTFSYKELYGDWRSGPVTLNSVKTTQLELTCHVKNKGVINVFSLHLFYFWAIFLWNIFNQKQLRISRFNLQIVSDGTYICTHFGVIIMTHIHKSQLFIKYISYIYLNLYMHRYAQNVCKTCTTLGIQPKNQCLSTKTSRYVNTWSIIPFINTHTIVHNCL